MSEPGSQSSVRLPLRTKLLYGVGQITESLKNTPFEVFLLFYYTQVLELSGTLVGLAILIAMAVDAVTDPLIGSWSDSFRSRWGRRHPMMYAAIVPFSVSLYLVFAPPVGLGEGGLFLWLLAFAISARVSITLFAVPYYAMGAEMTSDYAERTTLVGFRTVFGTLGIGAVIYVAFGVFFAATPEFADGQLNRDAYPPFAMAMAAAAILVMLISSIGTHDRIAVLQGAGEQSGENRVSPTKAFRELREIAANPSFRALFLGSMIFFITRGVSQSLGLHMGTYFWALSPKQLQIFNLSLIAGMVAAILLIRPLLGRSDKREILLVSVVLFIFATALPPFLALVDLFPAVGSPQLLGWLVAFTTFSGVAGGLMYITSHSMMGDVADDHEVAVRRRAEGILFGCIFLSMKAASGIGHQVAGLCLQLIEFPMGIEPADMPAEAIWRLGALYAPTVAVLGSMAVVAYRGYSINRERHAETLRKLQGLRAQGS
jgi:Na+/melibiose symporter-like transporter